MFRVFKHRCLFCLSTYSIFGLIMARLFQLQMVSSLPPSPLFDRLIHAPKKKKDRNWLKRCRPCLLHILLVQTSPIEKSRMVERIRKNIHHQSYILPSRLPASLVVSNGNKNIKLQSL